ncbi:MAG: hypothetical protein J6M14_01505 [Campylobacter sp.]|nr:hypothetical protein [Campylobacter sp.]
MIKTKYDIKINIDDREFDIVVREPNKAEKKELDLKSAKAREILSVIEAKAKKENELLSEANAIKSEIEINRAIIANADIKDRLALLWENKKLNKRARECEREIANLGSSEESVREFEAVLEESFEFKSKLLIEGAEFLSAVGEFGISHKKIWEILSSHVAKAQEKK